MMLSDQFVSQYFNADATWKEEVNRYLKADRENEETEILEWWKKKAQVYPNLARMARGIVLNSSHRFHICGFVL